MSIESILASLKQNGMSPEEFTVSTERLVEAAIMTDDMQLEEDLVARTVKLTGVPEIPARMFISQKKLQRICRGLDEATRDL